MHFTILCVGKIKETYLQAAVADYVSRLSKYVRIDVIEVAEEITRSGRNVLKKKESRFSEKLRRIAASLRSICTDAKFLLKSLRPI